MIVIIAILALAVPDGPPPYRESLQCAGLTRAWSDREQGRPGAAPAREDAEFWAFALMDSARRDGMTANGAEADYLLATEAARDRFARGDEGAARDLAACRAMIPTGRPAD